MKKFSEVSVLYRDALPAPTEFIWYQCDPRELSMPLALRGNQPLCAWIISANIKAEVDLSLLKFASDLLTIAPSVFADCPSDCFSVLVIRFTHGQDARIPVFVAATRELPREQKLFPLGSEDIATFRFPNGESVGPFESDGGLPLTYDFRDKKFGNTARLKLGNPRPINIPCARCLRMTLKGDGSYHRISVRFNNGYDSTVYSSNTILLDFDDIRTIEFVIPAEAVLPLALNDVIRIVCTPGNRAQTGRLVLYDITVSVDQPDTSVHNSEDMQPSASLTYFPAPKMPVGQSSVLSEIPSRLIWAMASDPARSAIFSCATSEGLPTLFYRPLSSDTEFLSVAPVTEHGYETEDGCRIAVCYHKFYLYDLTPDTAYEYRLNDGPLQSFRTFPADPNEFSVMFLEDVQIGNRPVFFERLERILAKEAAEIKWPCFMMTLGDIVHSPDSAVEYERILTACGEHFQKMPVAVTVGNHEYSDYDLFDIFARRHAMPEGADLGLGGAAYSFTVGDYTFFAVSLVSGDLYPQYLDRLDKALQECHSKWKIVFLHCSPYTGQGGFFKHRMMVAPILERGGVDIVFSGHSHIYIRASVWEDKVVAPEDGILYLTMGAAGHRMFANDRGFWQDYVYGSYEEERTDSDGMPDPTCSTAKFSTDRVELSVQTLSGKTVDHVIVRK